MNWTTQTLFFTERKLQYVDSSLVPWKFVQLDKKILNYSSLKKEVNPSQSNKNRSSTAFFKTTKQYKQQIIILLEFEIIWKFMWFSVYLYKIIL